MLVWIFTAWVKHYIKSWMCLHESCLLQMVSGSWNYGKSDLVLCWDTDDWAGDLDRRLLYDYCLLILFVPLFHWRQMNLRRLKVWYGGRSCELEVGLGEHSQSFDWLNRLKQWVQQLALAWPVNAKFQRADSKIDHLHMG